MIMLTNEHPSSVNPRTGVPANYRKGASHNWHQRRRHRAVIRMIKGLTGSVLDYGCGYGDIAYAISQTHAVQGVDVDRARVSFATAEYAPISFAACDPEGTDFPNESFDIVTSVVVIHFVPSPAKYLSEIRRVLKPGGHLIVMWQNAFVLRNFIRRVLGRPEVESTLWCPSRRAFEQILREQGFRIKAESYFYDPPFDGAKSPKAVVLSLLVLLLYCLRIPATCSYHTILAERC